MNYQIHLSEMFGNKFSVSVSTPPSEEGSRLVDEIDCLPCYRSAELLAQYFCVKHGVDEYFVPDDKATITFNQGEYA